MDELGGVLAGILLLLGAPHLADGVVQGHQLAHGASQVLHSVPVGQASVQGAEGLLSLVVAPHQELKVLQDLGQGHLGLRAKVIDLLGLHRCHIRTESLAVGLDVEQSVVRPLHYLVDLGQLTVHGLPIGGCNITQ